MLCCQESDCHRESFVGKCCEKNLTRLNFVEVQALSLPMLCCRYACVCLCIVLVPMAWFWAFISKFVLLLWPSGLLSDSVWSAQICSVTLAQGLWDCMTWWGHCPSHLGAPLAHLLSEISPLVLLPDPGSCCTVLMSMLWSRVSVLAYNLCINSQSLCS